MNAFERRLLKKIGQVDLSTITPGVVIDVHRRGERIGNVRVGQTYPYYDLASLTKVLFTASRSMMHFSEHPDDLDRPLRDVLPWWKNKVVTPRELLSHTAGLEWWVPLYKKMRGPVEPDSRWRQMKKFLAEVRTKRRPAAIYSDIDLWMMGAYLEARLDSSLLDNWELVRDRLNLMDDMNFHVANKIPRGFKRSEFAPTEDCPWRGRVLQGEVHDENAWALGGVAPHAGLFGSIESVSDWGLKLRAAFLGESDLFGDPRMVRHFVGRRLPRSVGDWGLCFMKPSRPRASCGRYFSLRSFGHTGFTGTSFWFDPVKDLMVVILSNRVHPTRENSAFVKLRPLLHDWICESL